MSLEAVLGRVDQILQYQQALIDPGSLAAAPSTSTSSGFAAQLASAQDAQPGSTLDGSGAMSSDVQSATGALPASFDVAGVGGNTGLSGAARMLAAAQAALGGAYNQGNHDAVSDSASQIQQQGTDCSGFVSYLMGPNGTGDWSQSYATPGIPTAPGIEPGKGSYVTIWNNPNPGNAGHVWIEILGQYFESSGSGGVHQMDPSEVNEYLNSGQYQPFHPAGM
ncbi:MAG TPA: hypothetical protein VG057_10680 [Solirubrobacteraceae bacterium]|jgi:hypothetical protein|nr:hypothetical protein [Solirubrobacteraceae bacterium]